MTPKEFEEILRSFAEVLTAVGAVDASNQLIAFATIFEIAPEPTVSAVTKRLKMLPSTGSAGQPNVGNVAQLLAAIKPFLAKISKSAVLKDISSLEPILLQRSSMEINAFVDIARRPATTATRTNRTSPPAPLRGDLVAHYKELLESALGNDEKFVPMFNGLASNIEMGKDELVVLAKQVTGASVKSRDSALKKLRSMHQSLLGHKAKSRATKGRTAA